MKTTLAALCLAMLGGATALLLPATSRAGNVGYYSPCNTPGIDYAITAAGHTPVAIATLDADSLAPLDGLVLACANYPGDPAINTAVINTAVANGLKLFLEIQHVNGDTPSALPGAPALAITSLDTHQICLHDTNLAAGSPIASGPGLPLNDTSLDHENYCSPMGYATRASLPTGAIPLLTTGNPDQVAAMSYTVGSGQVVFSISQFFYGLPGGEVATAWAGVPTYHTNVIAWMMVGAGPQVSTTCASEGYTGTKLTWCKNICENGLSGQVLDTWIQRWVTRYRDLPYCAVEGGAN